MKPSCDKNPKTVAERRRRKKEGEDREGKERDASVADRDVGAPWRLLRQDHRGRSPCVPCGARKQSWRNSRNLHGNEHETFSDLPLFTADKGHWFSFPLSFLIPRPPLFLGAIPFHPGFLAQPYCRLPGLLNPFTPSCLAKDMVIVAAAAAVIVNITTAFATARSVTAILSCHHDCDSREGHQRRQQPQPPAVPEQCSPHLALVSFPHPAAGWVSITAASDPCVLTVFSARACRVLSPSNRTEGPALSCS